MNASIWLYDSMTFLYAIVVLLYFIDFLAPNRKINRFAFAMLGVVWVMQTIFFIFRTRELNYVPMLTHFETLIFFSWILITFSLVINFFYKMDLFTFFTNVLGFAAVAFDTFTHKGASSLGGVKQPDLLVIHISMAALSYAAFAVSAIFAIMYLIQEKLLKEKRWNNLFRRLPAVNQLDVLSHRLVIWGFPLLLVANILGAILYQVQFGHLLLVDPKPIVSFGVLLAYGVYLYLKSSETWSRKRLAWFNFGCFMLVILNFLFVGMFFIGFHKW
ncbi:MAG: hypothetical protein JWN30_1300 [Bacilli bacterium]|nr:hypothetical protein [Bacilli bacterium]